MIRIVPDGADALLDVKAIPGAKHQGLAGALGDRLKVKVNAPAEGGKANKAVCEAVARALGVSVSDVSVESGHTDPYKTLRIAGHTPERVRTGLVL